MIERGLYTFCNVTVDDPAKVPEWIPGEPETVLAARIVFPDRIVRVFWNGRVEISEINPEKR